MSCEKRKRPLIVPLFIPNQGCPYRCVYCRQEDITGEGGNALDASGVDLRLSEAVRSPGFDSARSPEIAFYGGTFTGLPPATMEALLRAAHAWTVHGPFERIRVSTRPDALGEDRLADMRRFGVTTVELGVQSMDDDVLRKTRRGYKSLQVEEAVRRLRGFGFRVGVQLMPGLPGDSELRFRETVRRVIELRPDMARLYPTVVLKETRLADWYAQGRYRPFPLDRAVSLCAEACSRFEEAGIPVIRIGLHASPSLREEGRVVAGPFHPAFGFMVRSAVYQKTLAALLPPRGEAKEIAVHVHPRDVPLARGYRNRGLRELITKTGVETLRILPDGDLPTRRPVVEWMAAEGPATGSRRPYDEFS